MYTEFYSLTAMPFRLSPDSRFFFGSSVHSKAMAFLNYGIAQGEGFVIVTGEVGAGKTTLVEHLFSTLKSSHYVVGRIVTTQLDSRDMVRMVAASFNIMHEGRDKSALLLELKQLFESLLMTGRRALLIVDEAQSLTAEAVEELRMLSNLQANGETSFQVILLGQPEFRQLLASPGFEQVRQRVTASYHLGPLDERETQLYIEHRLTQAGWRDDPHITADAFVQAFHHTSGIPRRINTLFARLLLLGYLDQKHMIDGEMVRQVAHELASELGPSHVTVVRPSAPITAKALDLRSVPDYALGDSLGSRLARMEEKIDRHERVIRKALALASDRMAAIADAEDHG